MCNFAESHYMFKFIYTHVCDKKNIDAIIKKHMKYSNKNLKKWLENWCNDEFVFGFFVIKNCVGKLVFCIQTFRTN